jgi:hypothetical protein
MSKSPKRAAASPPRPGGRTSEDRARSEKIQRQLDEALAASFPASDPVSIVTSNEEEDWGEPENGRSPKSSE